MELVSFEKKASKEKKQNENKKNKLPEGALHLFIHLHNTSLFLCNVIVRELGVKKTKTLKEGIEPDVESDKFMIFPDDLTPVILHYKISLKSVGSHAHNTVTPR